MWAVLPKEGYLDMRSIHRVNVSLCKSRERKLVCKVGTGIKGKGPDPAEVGALSWDLVCA